MPLNTEEISSTVYDTVLKGGTIIDPAQGIYQRMDVALRDGKIAELKKSIDAKATEVFDVYDKLVVPGLIDLHTHVYFKIVSTMK